MTEIALIGNPNSGKTSLFNLMTGTNQRVGNWPGVTVERKDVYKRQAKGREFDNTVKTVHEFRAEEISKLVKHRIGTIFTGSSKANASFYFTCTSI